MSVHCSGERLEVREQYQIGMSNPRSSRVQTRFGDKVLLLIVKRGLRDNPGWRGGGGGGGFSPPLWVTPLC